MWTMRINCTWVWMSVNDPKWVTPIAMDVKRWVGEEIKVKELTVHILAKVLQSYMFTAAYLLVIFIPT